MSDKTLDQTLDQKIDPTKTKQVAEFKHERPLTTCRIDPTGRYVVAGAEDLHVHRWELQTGEKTTLTGHESWVRSLDFSPTGRWLYTAGWDGQVRWWETAAKKPQSLRSIEAHQGFARWVFASPCGRMLATCGNDRKVRVWDAGSGEKLAEMTGHNRHPYAVLFHPQDGHLVSQDLMGVMHVWNTQSSTPVQSIDASVMTGYDKKFAADMGGARDFQFNAQGTVLASAGVTNIVNSFAGTQDPIIVLVDWAKKTITHHLRQAKKAAGVAWGVRFHPDGFIAGAFARQNGRGELHFWRLPEQSAGTSNSVEELIEVTPLQTVELKKSARGLDFTPDARRLAIADAEGYLRIYEMA